MKNNRNSERNLVKISRHVFPIGFLKQWFGSLNRNRRPSTSRDRALWTMGRSMGGEGLTRERDYDTKRRAPLWTRKCATVGGDSYFKEIIGRRRRWLQNWEAEAKEIGERNRQAGRESEVPTHKEYWWKWAHCNEGGWWEAVKMQIGE